MRPYIVVALLILLNSTLVASSDNTDITQESNVSKSEKKIVIDLDKELEKQKSRGEIDDIIYGILQIGDNNDEVAFVGTMLADASGVVITISDEFDKLKKTIKDSLTISTDELKDGDMVKIEKDGKVLMEKEVEKRSR